MPWYVHILMRLALLRYPTETILGRDGIRPYRTRYYLLGTPRNAGAKASNGWEVYLHCFHTSDDAEEFHNHPWKWALSVILSGGYREVRLMPRGVSFRDLSPGSINMLKSTDFHRIDLYSKECWTLFITGPRIQDWGFLDRMTRKFTPWRQFCRVGAPKQSDQRLN